MLSYSAKLFLKFNYLQITTTLTKNPLFTWKQSTIQYHQTLYSSLCLPPQTHYPAPMRTLPYILNTPPLLNPLHHLCPNHTLTPHSNKYFLDLIKYLKNKNKKWGSWDKTITKNKWRLWGYNIISEMLSYSAKLFLKFNYLQITTTLTKNPLFTWKQSTIQYHQTLYSSLCLPPQTHYPAPMRTLPYILNTPPLLNPLHHLCPNHTLTPHSNKYFLDLIKYLKNKNKKWGSWDKTITKNKWRLWLNWLISNIKH